MEIAKNLKYDEKTKEIGVGLSSSILLKHAVDLYRTALNGGIVGAQGAKQQQQRENVRNNARDEGYEPNSR